MLTPMQKQKRLAFHAAAFSILLNSIQKDTDKYAQVDEAMEKIEGFYELIQQLRNSY